MRLSSVVNREIPIAKRWSLTALFLLFFLFALPVVKSADFFPAGIDTVYASEDAAKPATPAGEGEVKAAQPEEKKKEYPPAPQLKESDYPQVKYINGRIMTSMVAQLHLWFAAFVLAVPIFVFIIEAIGMATKDKRYDKLAYEFIKVSLTAYSITAVFGGLLLFTIIVFYPDFMKYMANIFSPTFLAYALLFFAESACLYIYYYGWHAMETGFGKWAHLTVGWMLNVVGTMLMFFANAWG